MTIENFMLCFFDQVQSLNRNEFLKKSIQTYSANSESFGIEDCKFLKN